jgi:tRNA A37 threonylcarbamoyladenosine modification protein TsaB
MLGSATDQRQGEWHLGRELGRYLHTHLLEIMAGTPWHSLDAIAVHTGAGNHTGMRIGLTVGITLAQQLGIPIYAVAEAEHALQLMAVAEAQYNQGIFPQWQSAVASLSPS